MSETKNLVLSTKRMLYAHMYGTICIGKGYLSTLAKGLFKDAIEVISTGGLTREALTDAAFNKKYGPTVARGDLLPDDVMFRLFAERMSRIRNTAKDLKNLIVLIEGLGRNAKQIETEVGLGIMEPENSMAIMLNGTEKICRRRFLDRLNRRPNGKRTDEDLKTFTRRFKLHNKNWPKVHARLLRTGIWMCQIDADRDIAQEVFPDVQSHLSILTLYPRKAEQAPIHSPLPYTHMHEQRAYA